MKYLRSSILVVALATGMISLVGCATNAAVSTPGAVNAFDSNTYQVLVAADAAIQQAKIDIAKYPQVKPALNRLITSYNTANDAYRAYHAAAVTGAAPDTAALAALIGALSGDLAGLKSAFGGAK